jgi:hypothetical protein
MPPHELIAHRLRSYMPPEQRLDLLRRTQFEPAFVPLWHATPFEASALLRLIGDVPKDVSFRWSWTGTEPPVLSRP